MRKRQVVGAGLDQAGVKGQAHDVVRRILDATAITGGAGLGQLDLADLLTVQRDDDMSQLTLGRLG